MTDAEFQDFMVALSVEVRMGEHREGAITAGEAGALIVLDAMRWGVEVFDHGERAVAEVT